VNKDIQKKWADALRSGRYNKCRNHLAVWAPATEERAYCALGVLIELAIADGVRVPSESPDAEEFPEDEVFEGMPHNETDWFLVYYDGMTSSLPSNVMKWAGLHYEAPRLTVSPDHHPHVDRHLVDGDTVSVTYLNDDAKLSFDVLADLIEAGEVI